MRSHEQSLQKFSQGGLLQVTSLQGGSKTLFAFSFLGFFLQSLDSPFPQSDARYLLWASDEGTLYPEAVHHLFPVALNRLLLVKTQKPEEVWRTGLEATQTGLFSWLLLRPSKACDVAMLRKIQLMAEKNKTRVILLCQAQLPHWVLTARLAVTAQNSLYSPSKQNLITKR